VIWFLESKKFINNSQYVCREGRSTSMALAELDTLIHTANSNNSTLYSLFFDLENAFPRVWQHLIIRNLHMYGLRGLLPRLIESYSRDRTFQVRVGNHLPPNSTQWGSTKLPA